MHRMPYRGGPGGQQGELSGGPLQRARLALMNGQPAVAEELTRRRLEKRPDETMTRLLLAQALIQQQRAKEAIPEVRHVLADQPKSVDALLLLSAALTNANQMNPPKEALEVAERAVQLQPKTARTHIQLAEVLMARRDFTRAREEADAAAQLEPRLAAAQLMRGMALLELHDYEGALQSCQNAIRQDSTLAVAYVGKARALTELKKPEDAMAALDEAQRKSAQLPPSQMVQLRSQIYTKQRRYGKAYNEYLSFIRKSGRGNNNFAPIAAGIQFFASLFGRYGPFVIIAVVALILIGISKIPLVGGWLVAALILGLVGFGAWNSVQILTGTPAPKLLQQQPRSAAAGVLALLAGLAIVLGIAATIVGRTAAHGHHVTIGDWLTPFTIALAGVVGFIGAALAIRYAPVGAKR